MTKSFFRPLGVVGAVLAMVAALLFMTSPVGRAAPDAGDTIWVGDQDRGYGGTWLFPIHLDPVDPDNPGEPDFWAYCIEHDVSAETGRPGFVSGVDGFLGDNHFVDEDIQKLVHWVLAHSYPAVSLDDLRTVTGHPELTENDAIEATQYAIWRYTDLTFDASWSWETSASEALYWYLLDGANGSGGLELEDVQVSVGISAPTNPIVAGEIAGPFVVTTNQASAVVQSSVALVDETGEAIDTSAVVNGQEFYLDLRDVTDAGEVTVTASASGSAATGMVISVPTDPSQTPTVDDHAQTIILVAPHTTTTTDEVVVQWEGALVPSIGTSLVDQADGDRVLPAEGGTVVDTVAYEGLTVGAQYRVEGQLVDKETGEPTGITGVSQVFTPTSSDGTVEVEFVVPAGFAGKDLVAFEQLILVGDTPEADEVVAVHEDIDDANQTVTVEDEAPSITEPPVTEPPVTEPPVTEPSATEPTTSQPTTSQPTTSQPTTSQPTSDASTTGTPSTSRKPSEPSLADTGSSAGAGIAIGGGLLLIAAGALFLATRRSGRHA